MSPFTWVLIAFPAYLFVRGRFVNPYIKLAA